MTALRFQTQRKGRGEEASDILLRGKIMILLLLLLLLLTTQVRFPGSARDFSPRVNFQCRLFHGVYTPPSAIACIYICAYVKDLVVHVRVR